MKRTLLTLVIIVVILGGAVGVNMLLMATKKPPEKKDAEVQKTLVEVIRAKTQTVGFDVQTQGTVTPRTETTLNPEVSGQIIFVSESLVAGGFFKSGEILLEIDPSNYEVALIAAEAQLARAEVGLMQENALSEQALKDWVALGHNREDASKLVLREPQLKEAKANIRSAQAAVSKAKRDLRKTKIRAPYEGMVRRRLSDLGQVVNPGSDLAEIFATDFVEVRLPLTAQDMLFLELPNAYQSIEAEKKGIHVILASRFGGMAESWEGEITRSEGTIDPKTRVMYAVAKVEDPYGIRSGGSRAPLNIGMFVDATISGKTYENVVVLPRYCLRGESQILVVDENDELRRRDVTVIRSDAKLVYIADGIDEGERICLTALEFVVEGMCVEAIEQDDGLALSGVRESLFTSL